MARVCSWAYRSWPSQHFVVFDGAGTEFSLLHTEEHVHRSLRVFITLCAQDQVYRTSDLLQMPIRYENFGLTIPIHIREHVYAYSPKPYLILCGLTSEAAETLCVNWSTNTLIFYGKWGTPETGYAVWAINKSIVNTLRDIVDQSTDRLAVTRYEVALKFSPRGASSGLGTIQSAPDTALPQSAYCSLFREM